MADKSLVNTNNQVDILKILSNSNNKYQKAIISKADKNLILAICDINFFDSETKNKLQKLFLRRVIKKSSLRTTK